MIGRETFKEYIVSPPQSLNVILLTHYFIANINSASNNNANANANNNNVSNASQGSC